MNDEDGRGHNGRVGGRVVGEEEHGYGGGLLSSSSQALLSGLPVSSFPTSAPPILLNTSYSIPYLTYSAGMPPQTSIDCTIISSGESSSFLLIPVSLSRPLCCW